MPTRCILLVVILLCTAPTVAEDEIAVFLVDNTSTPMWKQHHVMLFEKHGLADQLERQGQLKYWKTDPFAKYRSAESVKGRVYLVSPGGGLELTNFATVKDKSAFEKLVERNVQKRQKRMPEGMSPTLKVVGDRRTIVTPPYEWNDGSGISSLGGQSHMRYADSVLVNSRGPENLAAIDRVPMPAIAKLVRVSKGKMWYLRYRPTVVPAAHRSAALALVAKAANVGLQRRDAESEVAYIGRRLLSETQLELLRSLVFDIDELVAFTQWAKNADGPFRGRVRLVARKGTKLSRMIGQLSASQQIPLENGNLGFLRLSLTIPKELRTVLASMVQSEFNEGGLAGLQAAINKGDVLVSARIDKLVEGLKIAGLSTVELSDDDRSGLQQRFGGSNGVVQSDLNPAIEAVELGPFQWQLQDTQGGTTFTLTQPGTLTAGSKLPREIAGERSRTAPLFELKLDLGPCVADTKSVWCREFLNRLETAYVRTLAPQSGLDRVENKPRVNYESLLGTVKPEGDWTFTVRVEATRTTLTADVVVVAQLHAFWRIRQWVR